MIPTTQPPGVTAASPPHSGLALCEVREQEKEDTADGGCGMGHSGIGRGRARGSRLCSRQLVAAGLVALVAGAAWMAPASVSAGTGPGGLCPPSFAVPPPQVTGAYDRQVLSLNPVMYLALAHPSAQGEPDLSGHGHNGSYLPAGQLPGTAVLPNGDPAASFDGQSQFVEVPSAPQLSVTGTGCLTVEAWIQPATLQFPRQQGTGYVYVLGKGTAGKYEYALRMYSKVNTEVPVRPNRVSAYAWNLTGGLGSGSYFQDPVVPGAWMMVAFVINAQPSAGWPAGYISIYKNGVLRGTVSLSQYQVTPQASTAPLRIATRELESYFQGAIGKVAVFNYILSLSQIQSTYNAMYAARLPRAG
jgi:Concanavalin A-like lectin/glucanases superfamily